MKTQEKKASDKQVSRFGRRAESNTVVLALPQPGGADILRAKKLLKTK